MAKDLARLKKIFEKTDGRCHLCHGKLCFSNHGKTGSRGAWHIEHSVPRAYGGSDHLNNLFAAHVDCNIIKSTRSSKSARKEYGTNRAPYCKDKKRAIQEDNTATGMVIGGIIGLIGGPWGFAIGTTIGGMIGNSNSPRS